MKNKDYREIQLSSSQLAVIFVGVLILGIVIFLLGVSVGKKQAQITKKTNISPQEGVEQVQEKTPIPSQKPENTISKELATHQKIKDETQKQDSVTEGKILYYVQIGAFNNKEAAVFFANGFSKKDYPIVILDPFPTDKKEVFRVRVGGFETREKAEEVKTKLKAESKKKSDYFIISSQT